MRDVKAPAYFATPVKLYRKHNKRAARETQKADSYSDGRDL